MTSGRRLLVALALLAGCKSTHPPASPDAGGSFPPKTPPSSPGSPLSQQELPTTDGTIARDNLEGQIQSFERLLRENPDRTGPIASLVGLLGARGQLFGHPADLERAADLAEKLVKLAPTEASFYLARAGARSGLHRFSDALADVAEAEKRGAAGPRADGLKASIAAATGRYADAEPLRAALAARTPDITNLGTQAALLGEMGRTDEAERIFIEAQHHYRDVSPFPVVWLYFQEGLMWERAGRLPRARELYEAAVSRLPGYAPATGHLAGVEAATGDRDRAIALLGPLIQTSDDPEYLGQLSSLLRDAGKTAEADALRDRAAKGYAALLARHPQAWADHAARFYLAAGADPARALDLANKNLATRPTREAHQLVLEAALAAKAPAPACQAADAALAACAARCDAHLHVLASRAYEACGKPDRAAAELAAAGAK